MRFIRTSSVASSCVVSSRVTSRRPTRRRSSDGPRSRARHSGSVAAAAADADADAAAAAAAAASLAPASASASAAAASPASLSVSHQSPTPVASIAEAALFADRRQRLRSLRTFTDIQTDHRRLCRRTLLSRPRRAARTWRAPAARSQQRRGRRISRCAAASRRWGFWLLALSTQRAPAQRSRPRCSAAAGRQRIDSGARHAAAAPTGGVALLQVSTRNCFARSRMLGQHSRLTRCALLLCWRAGCFMTRSQLQARARVGSCAPWAGRLALNKLCGTSGTRCRSPSPDAQRRIARSPRRGGARSRVPSRRRCSRRWRRRQRLRHTLRRRRRASRLTAASRARQRAAATRPTCTRRRPPRSPAPPARWAAAAWEELASLSPSAAAPPRAITYHAAARPTGSRASRGGARPACALACMLAHALTLVQKPSATGAAAPSSRPCPSRATRPRRAPAPWR